MSGDRAELVAKVNRIYWETDTPVTEMAEQLGISRRTIYDMLRPAPAHERCPVCGGELVYSNRSARLAGEAVCSNCGRSQDITLLHELTATATTEPGARGEARTGMALALPAPTALRRAMPHASRFPLPPIPALLLGGAAVALLAALLVPARRQRRWWR